MDRKTIVIVVVCLAAWLGMNAVISKYFPPPKPLPQTAANSLLVTNTALTNPPETFTTTNPNLTASATNTVRAIIETNAPEALLMVTNEEAIYTFTTHGGGIKLVELTGISTARERKEGLAPTLNAQSTEPILGTLPDGVIQGNGIFQLTRTATGVRVEKHLANGLSVIKEFTPTSNYLVAASIWLENQSAQSLAIPEQRWVVGTATPLTVDDTGLTEGVMWYNGSDKKEVSGSYFANRRFGCLPGTPISEYREGQSNVVWAAIHNQFFTIVAMPQEPAQQVFARPVDLPPPNAEEIRTNSKAVKAPKGYEAALIYPGMTLAPKQSVVRQITVYAGPKEYQTLATVAARFNNNVDAVMGFGFFGFVSKALLLGMNWLHSALHLSYGWAIIAITVIIKLLFWPLTAASTRSMKRMQALQPQMKAIAEKYKDDPLKKNQKTMEFMKENKVSPLGGCLPMLFQMPVFFGFFSMIRSSIELRGAPFLWIHDLSRPDTLFIIPGIYFPFNLLPLLMGATMLWQARLTPPSPGMDPMQQKIMRYMPLIFMVFLYNYSAGLALYWTVNNLLTILQTKLTKTQPVPASHARVLTSPPKKKK